MLRRNIPDLIRNGRLPGAEPFSLGAGPVGCLLVHGFTSTPYDVRRCAEALAREGIATEGILLAGHGTHPADLARTGLSHWLASIREGASRLRERCRHVFALGISLSGNFLLTLAPELRLAGLVLIGTPLRFRYERTFRTAYRALRAFGREYQRKWYLEALDPEIRAARPTYAHFPLRCAPDCLEAIRRSRANLPRIRCPVLILQSTTDHAVDERTLSEFRTALGSPDVTVQLFPNRYHVLLIDHGAEEVFDSVARFLRTRTPRSTLAPKLPQAAPAFAPQPLGSAG